MKVYLTHPTNRPNYSVVTISGSPIGPDGDRATFLVFSYETLIGARREGCGQGKVTDHFYSATTSRHQAGLRASGFVAVPDEEFRQYLRSLIG